MQAAPEPDALDAAADVRDVRRHAYENPRPEVQELVPPNSRRVLDLGCSSGAFGAALKAANPGMTVVGVEIDPGYAADAAARLDRVVTADVEELARSGELEELGRFDCLVAADVLEHLVDPWTTLRAYGELVDPGGALIVSLPNVKFWQTFWELLVHDRWPRHPEGIFDATHLRWFTYGDAWWLVTEAGFEVTQVRRQMRLRPWVSPADRLVRPLGRVKVLRSFFTYQHLVAARKR
jgi:SAM-dependent methyltransferase